MDKAGPGADSGLDESLARACLARMAEAELPPSWVSVDRARDRGRRALHWHRAGQAGVSALAVLVVAVVAVASGAAFGPAGLRSGPRPAAAPGPAVTPVRQFNPLIPYAAFGWLPPGESTDGGQLMPADALLTAGPGAAWGLTVWAQDRCRRSGSALICAEDASSGSQVTISGPAPRVAGHPAYWLAGNGGLAWRYAPHSWAVLTGPGRRNEVKVASRVRYAVSTRPSIEFPAQLTAMPAAWRVTAMYFVVVRAQGRTLLRASEYSLGGQPGNPELTTNPAAPSHRACYFYPGGESVHQVINGYHVIVTHVPAASGRPPVQQVCAARADGLMIFISTYGQHPALNAIAIFAHHTRLLGPDPAHWTTQPLT
jgi:hypothetical protein